MSLFFLALAPSASVDAGVVYFEKDFDKMGKVGNTSAGICSAVANVNSFAFLWNQFPGVYGNTNLLPDNNGNGLIESSELIAARDQMAFGWTSPTGIVRPGIYGSGNNGTARQIWENTYWWLQDFAPNTSILNGQIYETGMQHWVGGSALERSYPRWDYLWDGMFDMADITLGIISTDNTTAHALTLTGLAFDDLDDDGLWSPGETPLQIGFVDPNKSTVQTWAEISFGYLNRMEFTWWQQPSKTFYVYRAYTEAPLLIPGDANADGIVDEQDAALLAANWGKPGASWAMGDFDGDKLVGPKDAAILAGNWGQAASYYFSSGSPPSEAAALVVAVPEPSAGALLVGLLCLTWFRRTTRR